MGSYSIRKRMLIYEYHSLLVKLYIISVPKMKYYKRTLTDYADRAFVENVQIEYLICIEMHFSIHVSLACQTVFQYLWFFCHYFTAPYSTVVSILKIVNIPLSHALFSIYKLFVFDLTIYFIVQNFGSCVKYTKISNYCKMVD